MLLIIVNMSTVLYFILNTFSNKIYSPTVRSRFPSYTTISDVTARLCGLNRLDGTMTDLQNIHWATCISWRPVIMPSNLYLTELTIRVSVQIKAHPWTIETIPVTFKHVNIRYGSSNYGQYWLYGRSKISSNTFTNIILPFISYFWILNVSGRFCAMVWTEIVFSFTSSIEEGSGSSSWTMHTCNTQFTITIYRLLDSRVV